MEQTCYRCGATVDEGTAFCKHCGAPQIRVSVPQEETRVLEPGTPGELQPAAEPVKLPEHGSSSYPPYVPALGVDWTQALPGALLAGFLLALCWVLPLGGFLATILAAGALSVALYRRRRPERLLSTGMGAKIGAISGIFGFGIFAVLMSLYLLATRGSGRFRQLLREVMQQAVANNPDPRAQEAMQKLLSPQGIAVLVTLGLMLIFAAFIVLSSIGGAIGAKLLRNREPR